MKNNTISIILIVLIFIIYIGYFTIMNVTIKNDTIGQLKLVEDSAKNGDWNKATETAKALKTTWHKKKYFIMFNFAEAEYSYFENYLNYIIGGTEGKQLDTTLSNILAAKELWKSIVKIVPEP